VFVQNLFDRKLALPQLASAPLADRNNNPRAIGANVIYRWRDAGEGSPHEHVAPWCPGRRRRPGGGRGVPCPRRADAPAG